MSHPNAVLGPADLALDVFEVAPRLLGSLLCRRLGGRVLRGRIVEVEAYAGPEDRASHARAGRTGRTAPMFGPPGVAYVYLIYGLHHCLNVVTGSDGEASAVLVRALEPVAGIQARCDGPGRLSKALGIDRSFDGRALHPDEGLWIEDPGALHRPVATSPRIGIEYAGEPWASRPWRFFLSDSEHLSRRRPRAAATPIVEGAEPG